MRVEVPLVGRANKAIKVGQLHPGSVVMGLFPTGMMCSFYVAAMYYCERNHGDPMVLLNSSCARYPQDYSPVVVVPRLDYLYCGERRFYKHCEVRAHSQSAAMHSSRTPLLGSIQNYIVADKEWQFSYAFGSDGSWHFKVPTPLAVSCRENRLLSDGKEKLEDRFLPRAAPHYLSTAQMPFTSAVGAAKSESFQAAIDAGEVLPDGSSRNDFQKKRLTTETEKVLFASPTLTPSIQALEKGCLVEAEGHVLQAHMERGHQLDAHREEAQDSYIRHAAQLALLRFQ